MPSSATTVGAGCSSTIPVTSSATTLASATAARAPVKNRRSRNGGSPVRTHSPGFEAKADVGPHLGGKAVPVNFGDLCQLGNHFAGGGKRIDLVAATVASGEMAFDFPPGEKPEVPARVQCQSCLVGVFHFIPTVSFFRCTGGTWCARSRCAIGPSPWNSSTAGRPHRPVRLPRRATSAPPAPAG